MASEGRMEFLAEESICGHALLRLVARGSSIIAEMQRLSSHLPLVFLNPTHPQQAKFAAVLFDFRYYKTPEMYQTRINQNLDLSAVDDEFQEIHMEIMERFYTLFNSVYQYYEDYAQYLKELSTGFFISHTVNSVLLDTDGRQLMCEALYLWGTMLLLLDELIPGPARERLIVAYFRYKGEGAIRNVDEVRRLCAATGFVPGHRKPAGYPKELFDRFPVSTNIVAMVLDQLRSEDIYRQKTVYPAPEHRSAAFSQQASMVYVILHFTPDTMSRNRSLMREVVSKHFNDNWVVPLYMGRVVDLVVEWEPYPAAHEALQDEALRPATIQQLLQRHQQMFAKSERRLAHLLTEGVLSEQFVIDNIEKLLDTLRDCNVALRWAILHRRTAPKKLRETLLKGMLPKDRILQFLLNTADLEFRLKKRFRSLLDTKEERWAKLKSKASELMNALSHNFSGRMEYSTVETDEGLEEWFRGLASQINGLDYTDSVMAGRTIHKLIKALTDVEQFETIDTSTSTKEWLLRCRETLVNMVRTVNVRDSVTITMDTVSDMAYAWQCITDFIGEMQGRVKRDPGVVVLLRAVFLKLTSVLDSPLVRILQADSPDTVSVAEYYSSEMVAFVRKVLEIVPITVFGILNHIISLQTKMQPLPVKLELANLKAVSQLDARYTLAKTTHHVSVFTEGMLQMKSTLLGIVEVDPRAILQDGIRKELVRQISSALHKGLVFDLRTGRKRNPVETVHRALREVHARLAGFRKSFEYIQDYINTYGLKMWQEEFSRILSFNVEQECNRYQRRTIMPMDSVYQSREIPVPLFPPVDKKHATFVGRLVEALLFLTDSRQTVYANESCSWYDSQGMETCGLELTTLLSDSIGVPGMVGIDRVLGFRCRRDLSRALLQFRNELKAGAFNMLGRLCADLRPHSKLAPTHKVHRDMAARLKKPFAVFLQHVLRVGQATLLRRQLSRQLQFSCRVESSLLCGALDTLNKSVLNDVRQHYYQDSKPYPHEENPLLPELSSYLQSAGMQDPLCQIYVTSKPMPHIALWLTLFLVHHMGKLVYDSDFGSLIKRRGADSLDGVPLVFGIATLLKQLHPNTTKQLLAYIGQYVRTAVFHCFSSSKPSPLGVDVVNMLLFVQQLCRVAKIPNRVLDPFIPSYVFDAVDYKAAK